MKKLVFILSILIICILSPCLHAQKEDNIIYWPYFSYPTLFIIEGNVLSGSGIRIQDYLIRHMPEYEHKRIFASPKRMFENLKHGAQYCVVGALKTPDREIYMYYSNPCRVSFYPMLVIRSKDNRLPVTEKSLSLKQLLSDRKLVFGEIDGIRYGNEINALLEQHKDKEDSNQFEIVSGPDALIQLMRMLVNHRVDYFIANPTTIQYFAKKTPDVLNKIMFAQIKEQLQIAAAGYVTCPKNDWGKSIIDKINKILQKAVTSHEFYSFALPWIQDDLVDEYKTQYNRLILNND